MSSSLTMSLGCPNPLQSHFLPLTQHHSDLAPTTHQIVNSVVQHIWSFTLWQAHQLRLSQVDQLLLVIHQRWGEKVHRHVAPRRQEGVLVPVRVTWGERLVRGQTAQKLFLGIEEFVLLLDLRRPVTDSTFPPYLFRLWVHVHSLRIFRTTLYILWNILFSQLIPKLFKILAFSIVNSIFTLRIPLGARLTRMVYIFRTTLSIHNVFLSFIRMRFFWIWVTWDNKIKPWRRFKQGWVFCFKTFTELINGSESFDNFSMMTATLMGVSGADALGHPVINLMFFIPIR